MYIIATLMACRCGIPVVLLGEAGIGKTHVLNYLTAWLGVQLLVLDVHGGTSEGDILVCM